MKIINHKALGEIKRRCPTCELCQRKATAHAHHWQSRGVGGGSRVDASINLVAICEDCHSRYHSSSLGMTRKEAKKKMLKIIAKREKVSESYILDELNWLNKLDKNAPRCPKHGKGKYAGYPLEQRFIEKELLGDLYGMFCRDCERKATQ